MTDNASEAGGASSPPRPYPVEFGVDYPARGLHRLTTAFRLILAIPIVILLDTVSGGYRSYYGHDTAVTVAVAGGLLFFPPLLMLLFRHRYPWWWYQWNRELLRFANRVLAYLALLDDRYPSTDQAQAVRLDLPDPEPRLLSRWLPLVKWLLAIPHYIVLFFLDIAAIVVVIVAWFAVLITGGYPRPLFDFVVGVLRWHNRVIAYAWILVTDRYPPFRLAP